MSDTFLEGSVGGQARSFELAAALPRVALLRWQMFGFAVTAWLAIVTGRVAVRYLLPDPHVPFVRLVAVVATACSIWLVLVPVLWWSLRRLRWAERGEPTQILIAFVLAVLAASVEGVWTGIVIRGLLDQPQQLALWILMRFDLTLVTAYAVLAGIVVLGASATAARLRIARLRHEAFLRSCELGDLAARLHPHFLFNTLNTVMDRLTADPVRARVVANSIADLLDRTTDPRRGVLHSLGDELELLDAYIAIQRERFGDRLDLIIDVPQELRQAIQVPAMSLQPLVENALSHGLELGRRPGQVSVHARRRFRGHELRVVSPAPDQRRMTGSGIGLSVTRRRLKVLYGRRASCQLRIQDDRATATIRLPLSAPAALAGPDLPTAHTVPLLAVPRRPFVVGGALLLAAVLIGMLNVFAEVLVLGESFEGDVFGGFFPWTGTRVLIALLVAFAAISFAKTVPAHRWRVTSIVLALLSVALLASVAGATLFSGRLALVRVDVTLVIATLTAAAFLTGYARRVIGTRAESEHPPAAGAGPLQRDVERERLMTMLVRGLRRVGELGETEGRRAERLLDSIVEWLRSELDGNVLPTRPVEEELQAAKAAWALHHAARATELPLQEAVAPGLQRIPVAKGSLVRRIQELVLPEGQWTHASLFCYGGRTSVVTEFTLHGPGGTCELSLGRIRLSHSVVIR